MEQTALGRVSPGTMLPTAALDQLKFDIADAEALANRGDVDGGDQLLATGLRRAGAARDAGQAWGAELVRRYQEAIAEYEGRHGAADDVMG